MSEGIEFPPKCNRKLFWGPLSGMSRNLHLPSPASGCAPPPLRIRLHSGDYTFIFEAIGQKLRGSNGSFIEGSFSQRGASSYWCRWGRGLGSGSGGWWEVVFLWKMAEKWGWGVGWGQTKEPASQCARFCQNYPLAIYPLVSPRINSQKIYLHLHFQFPGRNYIRPPPPPPISGQKAFSSGGGWGCIFWGPTRQEFYTPPPPPFYTPPTPRRVFSGVGGWGCIKFGPVQLFLNYKCNRGAPIQQFPRVTRIGSLVSENPVDPRRATRSPRRPRRDPAKALENPLRGKFPRRASRRVVTLGSQKHYIHAKFWGN